MRIHHNKLYIRTQVTTLIAYKQTSHPPISETCPLQALLYAIILSCQENKRKKNRRVCEHVSLVMIVVIHYALLCILPSFQKASYGITISWHNALQVKIMSRGEGGMARVLNGFVYGLASFCLR